MGLCSSFKELGKNLRSEKVPSDRVGSFAVGRWRAVPGQKRTYVENKLMSELSHKRIAMKPSLSIAANGHVTLGFGDYDSVAYQQVCTKLEKELGFSRQGAPSLDLTKE